MNLWRRSWHVKPNFITLYETEFLKRKNDFFEYDLLNIRIMLLPTKPHKYLCVLVGFFVHKTDNSWFQKLKWKLSFHLLGCISIFFLTSQNILILMLERTQNTLFLPFYFYLQKRCSMKIRTIPTKTVYLTFTTKNTIKNRLVANFICKTQK